MALNKQLQEEVDGLQGAIVGEAEKHDLPERFHVAAVINKPQMVITDTETNKSTVVPLYAYSTVRDALNNLFGE